MRTSPIPIWRASVVQQTSKCAVMLAIWRLHHKPETTLMVSGMARAGGSEAGSYLRRMDSRITRLTAQGPSGTCNESKEAEDVIVSGKDRAGGDAATIVTAMKGYLAGPEVHGQTHYYRGASLIRNRPPPRTALGP